MLYCTGKQRQNNDEYHLEFYKLKSLVFPLSKMLDISLRYMYVCGYTYTHFILGFIESI